MAEVTFQLDQMKLRELRSAVSELIKAAQPTSADLQRVVSDAAATIADRLREIAPASDIRKDVFHTVRPRPAPSNVVAHLAGIRLRGRSRPYAHNYREWRARFTYTRLRWRGKRGQKRAIGAGQIHSGQLVGMSLAKMFERGTRKIKKQPFFFRGIRGGERRALSMIARWVQRELLSVR